LQQARPGLAIVEAGEWRRRLGCGLGLITHELGDSAAQAMRSGVRVEDSSGVLGATTDT